MSQIVQTQPAHLQGTSLQQVWVVILAPNEETSLPLVLNDLPDVGRVRVVDNGSTDGTRLLLSRMMRVSSPNRRWGMVRRVLLA